MIISNDLFSVEIHASTGETEGLRQNSNPFINWARRGKTGMPSALQYLDRHEVFESEIKLVYQFLIKDIKCFVHKKLTDRGLEESYEFLNDGKKEIELTEEDLGIYLTFADGVDIPAVMPRRSVSNLSVCGCSSFVTSRMRDGKGLAMVLTEGSLSSYSVERGRSLRERGDIILESAPKTLKIGESYKISWIIFPFEDENDFLQKAKEYSPAFLELDGELCRSVGEDFCFSLNAEMVFCDEVEYPIKGGRFTLPAKIDSEKKVEFVYGERKSFVCCRSYNLSVLVSERSNAEPISLKDNICHCLLLLAGRKRGFISSHEGEALLSRLEDEWTAVLSHDPRPDPYAFTALSNLFLLWGEISGEERYSRLGEEVFGFVKESKEGKYLYLNPICGVEKISPEMARLLEEQENLDFSETVFSYERERDMALIGLALGKEPDVNPLLTFLPINSRDYKALAGCSYWRDFREGDVLSCIGFTAFADLLFRLEKDSKIPTGRAKRFASALLALYWEGEGFAGFSFPRKINDIEGEGRKDVSFASDFALGYLILKELI